MRTTRNGGPTKPVGRSTIKGLVSPAGWDDDGQVVAVCIVSDQGNPCFVLPGGAAADVRAHLRRYVAVTGRLEMRQGVRHMLVESVVTTRDPESVADRD